MYCYIVDHCSPEKNAIEMVKVDDCEIQVLGMDVTTLRCKHGNEINTLVNVIEFHYKGYGRENLLQ